MTGALVEATDVAGQRRVRDAADVVIVGSGAAGATAARVLTEAGVDVVVLEEGPHVRTEDLRSDMYTTFKRLWRDMGFQVAQGRSITPILQGSCIGGTTAINGAIMHRLPAAIRDQWCRYHGAGELLGEEALERVFVRLDDELGVAPAPDAVFGKHNALMQRGVEALALRGNRIRRNVIDCQGSAHCNQGCPTARRQSMNNAYVPRAVRQGARVYADCHVDRIVVRRGRATGVTGSFRGLSSGDRGPPMDVEARHAVIVAASAIQTPLLLIENGIGRRSRLVGERLQAHPGTGVVGVFDEPVSMWFGATQGYESTHYWHERMKFETVSMPLELASVRIPGVGPAFMDRLADYGHLAVWGVQVRAEARGRVSRGLFGGKRIQYDLTDADVGRLKVGVRRLVDMMFAAGAREVLPGVHGLPERITRPEEADRLFTLPDDPRYFHCIAAHLFGTAVMGTSPEGSVVAPDGQVHGVPGLYVADSSIFPTNMGVNPQHTICAVSWLIAERLADRFAG